MARTNSLYEPHLALREVTVPPGGEWSPRLPAWGIIQISSGIGYWLHPKLNRDLETGTVLAHAPNVQGSIRASQLGGLSLHSFLVYPERLVGLMTLSEQRFFEAAAFKEGILPQFLPPSSPVASKMKELCAARNGSGAAIRLQLLQLFFEVFGNELEQEAPKLEVVSDAKARLWVFLKQTPTSDLLHISFTELVQMTRCTPRHFSRVFREVVGLSFRDKQAELRLARACKLLATTESKVVDVALESGYQSLSLFNLMFTRRFGMSPGKWRQKSLNQTQKIQSRRRIFSMGPGQSAAQPSARL